MREGNLEAPTRHPLDWKSEVFYDEGKTFEELERVFGICHGCRRCAGHDGTWGVKKEYYDNSMKIGRPVFRLMAAADPDWVSSDCPIAARHIVQGIRQETTPAAKAHPLTLLRKAYGI